MEDEPVKRCPRCRCKVKRLIGTGAGIIFKGSGFYETDYRSKDYSEARKKEETGTKSADKPKEKSKKEASDKKKD